MASLALVHAAGAGEHLAFGTVRVFGVQPQVVVVGGLGKPGHDMRQIGRFPDLQEVLVFQQAL